MNQPENVVSITWRVAVTLSVVTSCAQADPQAEQVRASSVSREANAEQHWISNAPGGDIVRVTPHHRPAVGVNRFEITVDPGTSPPRSVDVVAPQMPMHGVMRYPAEQQGQAWIVEVDVPMPGKWLLYVNFDDGANAAAFPFTVATVAEDSSDVQSAHHH